MTCIVGIAHNGKVYIGGDSAGVGGSYELSVRADRKVFRNGDFIMGFTSSFRMGQLLAQALTPPKRYPEDDVYKFMVTNFVDAVRTCLKAGGYAEKHNDAERGGTFLVGYAGRLFSIYGDYQVGENADGYAACGCGEQIALGSLHSTEGQPPERRIDAALRAAERFSGGVRAPFHVVTSE
jgi:ATP-dependent protease HslVU (ClpYQ) peptidase subunit